MNTRFDLRVMRYGRKYENMKEFCGKCNTCRRTIRNSMISNARQTGKFQREIGSGK